MGLAANAPPMATNDCALFAPGQILEGKYKIVSLLGKGGMGSVYRVHQLFLNKELAIKILDSQGISDDVKMRRFQLEAKAAYSLSHPNLVKVHDFGLLNNGQPYLVMDLVEGVTLADYIKEHGPLAPDQAKLLLAQVCLGLSYAHQQSVIHRDIKPSNIMLVNDLPLGAAASVKIVDFGIAKLISEEGGEIQALTRTGELFGSPLYMSPEQCSGHAVDHRSDIYSLGCVLFEALTGTPPHVGPNPLRTMMLHQTELAPLLKEASLGKEFPQILEQIVRKMLHKSPFERYQNLGLVALDLSSACADGEQAAGLKSAPKGPRKVSKVIKMKSGQFYALLLITVLLTFLVTVLFSHVWSRPLSHNLKAPSTAKKPTLQESVNLSADVEAFTHGYAQEFKLVKVFFDRAAPITSCIETHDGVTMRRFVFPDCAIGRLSNRSIATPSMGRIPYCKWEARGVVWVPTGIPLTLEVDGRSYPQTLEIPSIVEKIDAKEFSDLVITGTLINGILDRQPPCISQPESVARILRSAGNWSNLHSLTLQSLPENKAALAALNNLKHLRSLELTEPQVDAAELAKQPFIDRLERLTLCKFTVDDFVRHLSGATNLQTLGLDYTSISPAMVAKLSRCSHLLNLELKEETIDDGTIKAIAQLKGLRGLFIQGTTLSPKQIRILTQCRWLHGIKLSNNSTASTRA